MSVENKETPFANLLGELETLQKSMSLDDDDKGEGDEGDQKIVDAADANGDGKKDGDDDKSMTKSLTVTLADGTKMEAEDGTELVKSLIARIDASDERATETEGVMAKALGVAVDLIKSQAVQLAETNKLVKSLQTKVGELSNEGRGRKTTVSVHEPKSTTMTKSEPEGIDGKEFMAKAMDKMSAGKLSGLDISTAEACLNRGQPVPEHIVARVMS